MTEQYEEGKGNLDEFIGQLKAASVDSPVGTIETTGNTFSGPACAAVAAQLEEKGELAVALMNNMFTQRKIPEIVSERCTPATHRSKSDGVDTLLHVSQAGRGGRNCTAC